MRNASPRFSLPFKGAAALAVLSGSSTSLAFPGIDLWPLAFVALVPLILALRGRSRSTLSSSDGSRASP